jgi:hypothetical protein
LIRRPRLPVVPSSSASSTFGQRRT